MCCMGYEFADESKGSQCKLQFNSEGDEIGHV